MTAFKELQRPLAEMAYAPRVLTEWQLYSATDGWSATRLLGEGGFGSVFKGWLPLSGKPDAGQQIAVKRVKKADGSASTFSNELRLATDYPEHPNLVRLVGHCPQPFILCYEFMGGGDLQKALSDGDLRSRLSFWDRLSILY